MPNYILTVFSSKGEKIHEESFEAKDDKEAKYKGEKLLEENNFQDYTSRVTSPAGKLVLFHR